MPSVATVIIPIGSYHKHLAQRAIDSATWQTVDCDVIALDSFPTPAIVRNTPVKTPFTVWLDADDWLDIHFVEECLRVYEQGKYVYTSWYCDDVIRKPNLCEFVVGKYQTHLVTTLYPTAVFQALGGFDETLPGHEDVDLYLRGHSQGICGIYLDKPLLHYSEHGQRSEIFVAMAEKEQIMLDVLYRNGGLNTIMGCCGSRGVPAAGNPGEAQPGDVQAQTLWAGMHSEVGMSTGRVYVGGNGGIINIAPEDVAQRPDLYRIVQDLTKIAPSREEVLRTAGLT